MTTQQEQTTFIERFKRGNLKRFVFQKLCAKHAPTVHPSMIAENIKNETGKDYAEIPQPELIELIEACIYKDIKRGWRNV